MKTEEMGKKSEGGRVLIWQASSHLQETIGIECGPRVVHTLRRRLFLPPSTYFLLSTLVFVDLFWLFLIDVKSKCVVCFLVIYLLCFIVQ